MKPSPFEYVCPDSLSEAVAILETRGETAKILAGGQSLIPALAFRLSAPEIIVDLKRVPGLDEIGIGAQGVRLGARVRWCDIERDPALRKAHPLLVEAVGHVAHYQIRNRGTVGGSLAHGNPAAELPGIAVTCEAEIVVVGGSGERVARAGDFFPGPLQTVLAPDEVITEMRLPAWPAERRWAFMEFARRRGDFALAGVALHYDLDGDGRAVDTHVGVIGATDVPRRLPAVEGVIDGNVIGADVIEAAAGAASAAVDPPDDFHAPAAYRRALVRTLFERGLRRAAA